MCLSSPVNNFELIANLVSLMLFSRKIEIIFGSKYILITYLITLCVTCLSFLPCNMQHMDTTKDIINPNSLNLVMSQIIFMKYRLEYLNSPLLNIAFLSLLISIILPDGLLRDHEARNILLSALISSVVI